jgi:hypothetical protein
MSGPRLIAVLVVFESAPLCEELGHLGNALGLLDQAGKGVGRLPAGCG